MGARGYATRFRRWLGKEVPYHPIADSQRIVVGVIATHSWNEQVTMQRSLWYLTHYCVTKPLPHGEGVSCESTLWYYCEVSYQCGFA